jgi:hypothetical protein
MVLDKAGALVAAPAWWALVAALPLAPPLLFVLAEPWTRADRVRMLYMVGVVAAHGDD